MEKPNLSRIVDTYVPVVPGNLYTYFDQLRRDVVPHIRALQVKGQLRWYSFLIHKGDMLNGREPKGDQLFIHIRLEPAVGVDINQFIARLPNHFKKPQQVSLSKISGVDSSVLRNQDWADAWKIHGEASEWVVCLLEGHGTNSVSLQQIIQFMHFISNPLMLGNSCFCIPGGFLRF